MIFKCFKISKYYLKTKRLNNEFILKTNIVNEKTLFKK